MTLEVTQKRQKRLYDEGRQDITYQKGDLVLLYYPVRCRGLNESLLHRWIGPYKVLDQLRANSYKLERIGSGSQTTAHVVWMKRYTAISPA